MDDGSRSTWLIVILLLLAAMLFAVMETAFASVSRVRIKTGAENLVLWLSFNDDKIV